MGKILYTKGLAAGYNGKSVVSDINIELHEGEIIALIGPNGTGKSTILKTLCGQLPPVSGSVFLKGRDLASMKEAEVSRIMSLLMTEKIDPELMTCEDVVSIGRYPYTGLMGRLSDHDREVIVSSMRTAHVEDLGDRYFSRISDGQKQRVLLAKAVCQEPDVLIMDEPTSFLDIRHKLDLLQILLKLVKEKNVAVIVSLHEIELAEKIADTVICVKDGAAQPARTVREVFGKENICRLFDINEAQYRWMYENGGNGENG